MLLNPKKGAAKRLISRNQSGANSTRDSPQSVIFAAALNAETGGVYCNTYY